MTTIAYKDGWLAADSRKGFTWGDIEMNFMEPAKIFKVDDYYMGLSGNLPSGTVLATIKAGTFTGELDMEYIKIRKRGIYVRGPGPSWHDESRFPYKYCAIGSGYHFAMGAMAHGATAEESVKVAMKFDRNTGGKVRLLRCTF